MAAKASGKHHASIDGLELKEAFHNIAANATAVDAVVSRFGSVIGGMIASSIILGYL